MESRTSIAFRMIKEAFGDEGVIAILYYLERVTFTRAESPILCISGKAATGKTTLGRILSGFDSPDQERFDYGLAETETLKYASKCFGKSDHIFHIDYFSNGHEANRYFVESLYNNNELKTILTGIEIPRSLRFYSKTINIDIKKREFQEDEKELYEKAVRTAFLIGDKVGKQIRETRHFARGKSNEAKIISDDFYLSYTNASRGCREAERIVRNWRELVKTAVAWYQSGHFPFEVPYVREICEKGLQRQLNVLKEAMKNSDEETRHQQAPEGC